MNETTVAKSALRVSVMEQREYRDQEFLSFSPPPFSRSHEMTSSIVSTSSLNFSFLNFSYVSLSTRTCGYFECGDPFFPGMDNFNCRSNLKTVSMVSTVLLMDAC